MAASSDPSGGAAIADPPADLQQDIYAEPARGSVWEKLIFRPMYDPFDMMKTSFDVRTKGATIVPFRPFRTQSLYVANMGLKNVVVKPRQVGSSTINLGLMTANAVTCPNVNTLIMTHRDDTTAAMRQTIANFIGWLNDRHNMEIQIGVNNENQLEIKNMDSWFFFGTAGGAGVGRSRTIQQCLVSELAHWNVPDPGAELGGILESVPDRGLVVAESTPNGAAGPFYDLYNSSSPGWTKHFFPWFIEPSRRIPLPPGQELHLNDEELALVIQFDLSHEQIAWRRQKMQDMQSVGLDFSQEYPEDDITCFTAGMRSYFPTAKLNNYIKIARAVTPHITRADGDPHDPGGFLRTFSPPRAEYHYIAYGDVGGGHRDGDMSVCGVRCWETGQLVAVLAGHWQPQKFADLSVELATRYNMAYLGHEANGIGQGSVNQAFFVRKYPNYHMEKRSTFGRDGVNDDWSPGLYVTPNQRIVLLNGIKDEIIADTFNCQDLDTVRQLTAARLEYVKSGGGQRETVVFPASTHDDYVMMYAGLIELSKQVVFSDMRAAPRSAY